MQIRPVYRAIATAIEAIANCQKSGNTEWAATHKERIEEFVKRHMPSGSGFDSGTQFDFDKSDSEKLVFNTAFHHMNNDGMYDGWSYHAVIITPAFQNFNIRITGPNRRNIKEYITEVFDSALMEKADESVYLSDSKKKENANV